MRTKKSSATPAKQDDMDGGFSVNCERTSQSIETRVTEATVSVAAGLANRVGNEPAFEDASQPEIAAEVQRRFDQPETATVILGLALMRIAGLTDCKSFFQCESTRWLEGPIPAHVRLLHEALQWEAKLPH
jgi:hypothetical protein